MVAISPNWGNKPPPPCHDFAREQGGGVIAPIRTDPKSRRRFLVGGVEGEAAPLPGSVKYKVSNPLR